MAKKILLVEDDDDIAVLGTIVIYGDRAAASLGETRASVAHALRLSRNKEETRPQRKHGVPPF